MRVAVIIKGGAYSPITYGGKFQPCLLNLPGRELGPFVGWLSHQPRQRRISRHAIANQRSIFVWKVD